MVKKDIIKDLEKQLRSIEADIRNYEQSKENFPCDARQEYQNKLERLFNDRNKLLAKIEKYQQGKDTIIDNIQHGLDMFVNRHQKKLQYSFLKAEIKKKDKKIFRNFLAKHNQLSADYEIRIEIEQLINENKQVVATRLITIKNRKLNQVKKYPAGGERKAQWEIEFERDLEQGYFKGSKIG